MKNRNWNWRGSRWIYTYIIFLIFSGFITFSSISSRNGQDYSSIIIAFVFFFSIWCAGKDFDINRKITKKIFWVVSLWVGQSLLGVVFLLIFAKLGFLPPKTIPLTSQTITGIIIIFLAMQRSTFFVNRSV